MDSSQRPDRGERQVLVSLLEASSRFSDALSVTCDAHLESASPGPVREQPHRVLGRRALVTGDASAPAGAAPFAATRERRCRNQPHALPVALALSMLVATAAFGGDSRPIDAERSTLTVFVYKSGLFSAFADDHVIRAPIASGSIDAPLGVEVSVRSATLTVLDPKLAADKRAEVQARMLGPEVLDSGKFPNITFTSTAVAPTGADRWTVTGRLTIHGETRPMTFSVVRQEGRYRGSVTLKQRDFGIEPISIAGGAVKVKDEIRVEFDLAAK